MLNISIELADACNLTCIMCSQHFKHKRPHGRETKFLSFDSWKKALLSLEKIKRKKQLSPFWDGEAMLHPEFNRFIKFAFEHNSHNKLFNSFRLNTNGVLMDDEKIKTLIECASMSNQAESTFTDIHFSLDAATPETFRKIKGIDAYDTTIKNILKFIDARGRLKFPRITVAFIVMNENIHEGKKFLKFWSEVFESRNLEYHYGFDWPNKPGEWIYFRRLNSMEPEKDERLHKALAKQLGYKDGLRKKTSF